MMRHGHIVAALLFVVMAGIQLNDPDPLYWSSAYFLAGLVAGVRFLGKPTRVLSSNAFGMVLAGLLISGPGAIDYLPDGDYAAILGQMTADKPYVESLREFGGLLIAAAYLVGSGLR